MMDTKTDQPPATPVATDASAASPATPESPAAETHVETPAEAPAAASETPVAETVPAEGETPAVPDPTTPPASGEAGSTAPAAVPAATDPKSGETMPPKEETKGSRIKHLLKKFLPVIIILIVILIGVAVWLVFFSKHNKPKATLNDVVSASQNSDASQSASVADQTVTPECVSNYIPFVDKTLSICYPKTMQLKEKEASSSAEGVKQYIFEDEAETLTILTDYKDNLNKFNCVSSKVVKVNGISALRYLLKDASKSGGCAGTVNTYATLVSSGNNKPVFYIGLTKKKGSYQSDNNTFATIEQSFQINQ